jgi:subtilisin family serine protease
VHTGSGASGADLPSVDAVPDTVLIGFRPGTDRGREQSVVDAAGAVDTKTIGAGTHVLRVPTGAVASAIARLQSHAEVRYAEPDYVVHADATPNDPSYTQLWAMPKIEADQAWGTTTGSRSIVVGVVDTGIDYTHPDLAPNVWTNPGNVGKCPAGTHGYNALAGSCDPMDDHNHGTHVSGTIGAVGNNGVGVAGINWSTSIMGLKFLSSSGFGSTSGAIAAIDWALKAKAAGANVRVLNNSWGGGGYSQALADEINKAGAADVLFVAAAGNSSANNDTTPFYPCSYHAANEICVASTEKNDSLSGFSNYGPSSVDLAAPGSGILSTVIGGGYATFSGTSMATPHVVGTAALILSTGYQSVSTLKSTILGAVDPVSSLAGRVATGGRLDVCNAFPACLPGGASFALSASPSRASVAAGAGVSYAVAVSPTGGFHGSVSLSVSGLPPAASASFAPNPVTVPGATPSTLSVTTGAATPPDTYALTITGTSGSVTSTTTVKLQVKRS